MDATEFWHWKYRVDALGREVQYIQDTVAMASAYRHPKTAGELETLQEKYDHALWLRAEAEHHVSVNS